MLKIFIFFFSDYKAGCQRKAQLGNAVRSFPVDFEMETFLREQPDGKSYTMLISAESEGCRWPATYKVEHLQIYMGQKERKRMRIQQKNNT